MAEASISPRLTAWARTCAMSALRWSRNCSCIMASSSALRETSTSTARMVLAWALT